MTSEVFVYLTLPGQTSSVTAGRFALDADRQGNSVGRFIYGRRYLERSDAVPIDPIELKLQELADLIVAEDELPEKTAATDRADLTQIQDLLLVGTAMGGARPRPWSR